MDEPTSQAEQSTELTPVTDKWYTPLTKETTLSKYFALAFLIICLVTYSLFESRKPSDEMKQLLANEAELSWPTPLDKSIIDRGCYRDGKGALQYDRRIHYNFAAGETVPALVKRIQSHAQWQQVEVGSEEQLSEWVRFEKKTGSACITIKTDMDSGYTVGGVNAAYSIFLDDCLDRHVCR